MNRTSRCVAFAAFLGLLPGAAAVQEPKPAAAAQPDPIAGIVQAMRSAEQAAKSFRIELQTSGQWPTGTGFKTSGTLHVLRGAQPKTSSTVEYEVVGDLQNRMATAQTGEGIWIYSDDAAFGEVFVLIEPAIVADLEWAGEVLARANLPGMKDRRAGAPLGSAMLDDLRVHFELAISGRKERAGEAGQWLAGERRAGLPEDSDLPLANSVELFVRDKDKALLEVVHHQGEKVLLRIEVRSLEVDVEIPAAAFTVDGRGQKLRPVRQHAPLWAQIQDVLGQAEGKALEQAEARATADGVPLDAKAKLAAVRPSKR